MPINGSKKGCMWKNANTRHQNTAKYSGTMRVALLKAKGTFMLKTRNVEGQKSEANPCGSFVAKG